MNSHPILRRDFLSSLSGGFTGLALTHLLAREASGSFAKPELNGGIHHRAKVKRVIQLFMNGGVSPMDTWDYKPALTKLDGQKLGSQGILTNCIAPGSILSEGTKQLFYGENGQFNDRVQAMLAHVPLGRPGQPEEIAHAVLFLAAPESSYLNGAIIPVDGGWLAGYSRDF